MKLRYWVLGHREKLGVFKSFSDQAIQALPPWSWRPGGWDSWPHARCHSSALIFDISWAELIWDRMRCPHSMRLKSLLICRKRKKRQKNQLEDAANLLNTGLHRLRLLSWRTPKRHFLTIAQTLVRFLIRLLYQSSDEQKKYEEYKGWRERDLCRCEGPQVEEEEIGEIQEYWE